MPAGRTTAAYTPSAPPSLTEEEAAALAAEQAAAAYGSDYAPPPALAANDALVAAFTADKNGVSWVKGPGGETDCRGLVDPVTGEYVLFSDGATQEQIDAIVAGVVGTGTSGNPAPGPATPRRTPKRARTRARQPTRAPAQGPPRAAGMVQRPLIPAPPAGAAHRPVMTTGRVRR